MALSHHNNVPNKPLLSTLCWPAVFLMLGYSFEMHLTRGTYGVLCKGGWKQSVSLLSSIVSIRLTRLLIYVFLCLPVACTTKPLPPNFGVLPVPGVAIGGEMEILDEPTEKVKAVMTPDGWVHLVAITKNGSAYHVAVSERGVERRETLVGDRRYGYYDNMAIVEDGQGRMHIAIDGENWIFVHDSWHLAGNHPCALLARTGKSVACTFVVSGSKLETPLQWGLAAFGGMGAGIVIPYWGRPSKLVLGSFVEDRWSYRSVIDPRSPYSASVETYDDATMECDALGRVYILYRAHSDYGVHVRYASLPIEGEFQPTNEWQQLDESVARLAYVESVPAYLPQQWFVPFGGLAFAVDPLTGKGVFFARDGNKTSWSDESGDGIVEVTGGVFSKPVLIPIPSPRILPEKIAPAGHEQFHTLVSFENRRLFYLGYGTDGWVGPVLIGEYGTPSLFLIASSSLQLVSDGRSQALAVWPKPEGKLIGRWVTLDGTHR